MATAVTTVSLASLLSVVGTGPTKGTRKSEVLGGLSEPLVVSNVFRKGVAFDHSHLQQEAWILASAIDQGPMVPVLDEEGEKVIDETTGQFKLRHTWVKGGLYQANTYREGDGQAELRGINKPQVFNAKKATNYEPITYGDAIPGWMKWVVIPGEETTGTTGTNTTPEATA